MHRRFVSACCMFGVWALACRAPGEEVRVRVAAVARPASDWRATGVAREMLAHLCRLKSVYRANAAAARRLVPTKPRPPLKDVSDAGRRLRANFVVIVELKSPTQAAAELFYVEDPEKCVAATRQRVAARASVHGLAGELALALAREMQLRPSPQERWLLTSPFVANDAACEAVWKGNQEREAARRLEFYQLALEHDPRSAQIHNLIGGALANLGQLDRALDAFDRAIQLRPDYAAAHTNRGLVLKQQMRWKEADAAFHKALTFGAKSATPYVGLARLSERIGGVVEAVEWLEKSLEIDPSNTDVLLTLADVFHDEPNLAEARRMVDRILEVDPENTKGLNDRALLLLASGEHEEAEATLRKALKIKPDLALTHANLGLVLFAQRRVQEATAALGKATELDPVYGQPHFYLGKIHMEQKAYGKAAESFQRAVELNPGLGAARRSLRAARALDRQPKAVCGCGGTPRLARADAVAATAWLAALLLGPHALRVVRRRRRPRRRPPPRT